MLITEKASENGQTFAPTPTVSSKKGMLSRYYIPSSTAGMQLPNPEEFQRAEASPSLKSIKTRTSEVCKVCSSVEAKYTCPRCALKTCSLQCCLRHKKETGCSGKRNLAAFVSRKDYDYFNFLSDYRLLEAVDRDNETRERQLSEVRNLSLPICPLEIEGLDDFFGNWYATVRVFSIYIYIYINLNTFYGKWSFIV
ncbi:unnamed protein product [Schistocephalus solidus]|uniref:HIT-type domain-containing protein n=1 Tax=Schistocephalus solidus TaxID=70667 RepID=A0A183TMP2_SCHSO|nr:unnamed protein product [Schistocephalus solidus]